MKKHKKKNLSPRKKKIQEARKLAKFYRRQIEKAEDLIEIIDRLLAYDGTPEFNGNVIILELPEADGVEYIELSHREHMALVHTDSAERLKENKAFLQSRIDKCQENLSRTLEILDALRTKPKEELEGKYY